MNLKVSVYIPKESPVHRCDARVKVALLAAFTVTVFVVRTWTGLALCVCAFLAVAAASRIPPGRYASLLVPVYVIAGFSVLFNSFSLDVSQAQAAATAGSLGLGSVSAGVLGALAPVALAGSFGFVPAGFARGCFYAVRIVLLAAASLVLTYTSTSTRLTAAFTSFLGPLRSLRVPVDDIAMVLSIALRFIPLTAEELGRIHDAQWSRGASFGTGSLWRRLRAWATIFVPLFVDLFRRADALAVAMDARCYGASGAVRTSLGARRLAAADGIVLGAGLAACAALCLLAG